MRVRTLLKPAILLAALAGLPVPAAAYPEYWAWLQQTSGRNVNCGMCHVHPDGPEGVKPGQIGSLSPEQMQRLTESRLAFKPGVKTRSPILNDFGNSVLEQLGRTEIIALRRSPGELAARLDPKLDADHDGIPDVREYTDGTDPVDPQSGSPRLLLLNGLKREKFHIFMMVLATAFGLYGLNHLLKGLHAMASRARPRAGGRAKGHH